MECDLIPYFWLHLQIGTFSCRWGQLFHRCLLWCRIIRLNYPKNADGFALPFLSPRPFLALPLCVSPLEYRSLMGEGANHVLSFLSTHLHSEGLLACAQIFKGCGSLTSGRRQRGWGKGEGGRGVASRSICPSLEWSCPGVIVIIAQHGWCVGGL